VTHRGYETPDIVVVTPRGMIAGEVKHRIDPRDTGMLLRYLAGYAEAMNATLSFSLLADPETIRFYSVTDAGREIATLSTRAVLRTYDANFDNHFIYETYLTTLLQAWLDDIAHHWKSADPPGVNDLPQELVELIAA
jgi:hypothetical protein